jgi:predicted DNA-binding transcriptional regulator AlpA
MTSSTARSDRHRRLLNSKDVAQLLGVTEGLLAGWRHRSLALPFIKVGTLVRYDRADVDSWLAQGTDQPQSTGIAPACCVEWSPQSLAAHLGVDASLLAAWRYRHQGPRFSKRHGRVVYSVTGVAEWLSQHTHATLPGSPGEEATVARHALRAAQRGERRRLAA